MKKMFVLLFILFIQNAYSQNMVLCWIFEMQGCPGVEAKQGSSVDIQKPGRQGIGATGAGVDRVERRTIITIPDYQIRKIQRFFGLGGTRINISHELGTGCSDKQAKLEGLENAIATNDLKSCLKALQSDVENYPRGVELNLFQCQDYFCQSSFKEKFQKFVNSHENYPISNIEQFLKCDEASIAI